MSTSMSMSMSEAGVAARPSLHPTVGAAGSPGGSLYALPIMRQFCIRHDLPYCETGLIDSYAQALRHLHTVGRR